MSGAAVLWGSDFKNNDLQPIRFDSGWGGLYHTRPMAGGPPDRVDCARLAAAAETLTRVYQLDDLPRLQDLLAESGGRLQASYAFGKTPDGGAGVTLAIESTPMLRCQRCLEPFALPVVARSEIEFSADETAAAGEGSEREPYVLTGGVASLRDLAEEELLLALPVAPACSAPEKCGRAPSYKDGSALAPAAPETVRPFSALQDLLKKP